MAKQSILGRISQLLKANINALIDQAEDPQLLLDQLVRDYTNSIAEAESAVAQTIGNLRLMEQDHAEDIDAAADWGRKALAASSKADELRAGSRFLSNVQATISSQGSPGDPQWRAQVEADQMADTPGGESHLRLQPHEHRRSSHTTPRSRRSAHITKHR